MTQEEAFRELFSQLSEAGLNPEPMEWKIPYFENGVSCGLPTAVGDVVGGDYIMVPRKVFGGVPTFFVTVVGSSMIDAGLEEGDRIQIEMCQEIRDGDIVLVAINGDMTVKSYFKDENGDVWLVPRNDAYDAFRLTEDMSVLMIGRVTSILKATERTSYTDCIKKIRQTRQKNGSGQTEIDEKRRDAAVTAISRQVKHARQWYAVYRAMVQRECWTQNDYRGFCELVGKLCPTHEHLPVSSEISRMCVMSFSKALAFWEEGNAPVRGQRFYDYLAIGNEMLGLLR